MNSELEACLTKAIYAFKVRDMLTKFGIPEDAEVTLKMQLSKNSQPIASCPVPTTVKKDSISSGSMSLTSLQDLLADDFINPAIETFELNKLMASADDSIENDQNKLIISLKSTGSNFNLDLVTVMDCCRFCGGICCDFRPKCP